MLHVKKIVFSMHNSTKLCLNHGLLKEENEDTNENEIRVHLNGRIWRRVSNP